MDIEDFSRETVRSRWEYYYNLTERTRDQVKFQQYLSLKYHRWSTDEITFQVKKIEEYVRKTGPQSNKIKQMQKQNTEDTQYKRDTDLHGSSSVGYVHQRNCQVLPLLLSSK
jgi:hypothetical protein